MTAWNEGMIARAISLQTLARRCTVLVNNCNWTGAECDVLAVTNNLRIIDVEVKISRSDLKADASKYKWWHRFGTRRIQNPDGTWTYEEPPAQARDWPPKVWKHYFAMPRGIWTPDLLAFLPSKMSGVLLFEQKEGRPILVQCARRATPNKDASKLKPEQVMDIARLANLRMWDAYYQAEIARADAKHWREAVPA